MRSLIQSGRQKKQQSSVELEAPAMFYTREYDAALVSVLRNLHSNRRDSKISKPRWKQRNFRDRCGLFKIQQVMQTRVISLAMTITGGFLWEVTVNQRARPGSHAQYLPAELPSIRKNR